jgi:hypothetical protein
VIGKGCEIFFAPCPKTPFVPPVGFTSFNSSLQCEKILISSNVTFQEIYKTF